MNLTENNENYFNQIVLASTHENSQTCQVLMVLAWFDVLKAANNFVHEIQKPTTMW